MNKKIGIGIITCNRPAYLKNLLNSIQEKCKDSSYEIVIVNDGSPITEFDLQSYNVLQNEHNLGVGKSKNKALNHLLNKGCEFFFLVEDDIVIKDGNVFQKYIKACRTTGIQHFNFAFHGKDNYDSFGKPYVRLKVDYTEDVSVCLYPNVYGAFSFYTKKCLERVGLMDEFYYNAMEHVDHTNKIILEQMHPPFRWFADIENSQDYLSEIDTEHSGSEIRKNSQWINNFRKAADHFASKFGFDVRDQRAYVASKEEVVNCLKQIKKLYKNE